MDEIAKFTKTHDFNKHDHVTVHSIINSRKKMLEYLGSRRHTEEMMNICCAINNITNINDLNELELMVIHEEKLHYANERIKTLIIHGNVNGRKLNLLNTFCNMKLLCTGFSCERKHKLQFVLNGVDFKYSSVAFYSTHVDWKCPQTEISFAVNNIEGIYSPNELKMFEHHHEIKQHACDAMMSVNEYLNFIRFVVNAIITDNCYEMDLRGRKYADITESINGENCYNQNNYPKVCLCKLFCATIYDQNQNVQVWQNIKLADRVFCDEFIVRNVANHFA
jgi:hypothetical protein